MGPMRRPMKETATAFSIREGTAQTVTSRLFCSEKGGVVSSEGRQGEGGGEREEETYPIQITA